MENSLFLIRNAIFSIGVAANSTAFATNSTAFIVNSIEVVAFFIDFFGVPAGNPGKNGQKNSVLAAFWQIYRFFLLAIDVSSRSLNRISLVWMKPSRS